MRPPPVSARVSIGQSHGQQVPSTGTIFIKIAFFQYDESLRCTFRRRIRWGHSFYYFGFAECLFCQKSSNLKTHLAWPWRYSGRGGGYSPPRRFFVDDGKTTARSAAKFCITINLITHYVQVVTSYLERSGHQVSLNDLTSHHHFATLRPRQSQSR